MPAVCPGIWCRNESKNNELKIICGGFFLSDGDIDGSVCLQKSFVGEGVRLDCSGGFGAVMMVTATFGMVAASKAIEKLVAGARRPSERVKPE